MHCQKTIEKWNTIFKQLSKITENHYYDQTYFMLSYITQYYLLITSYINALGEAVPYALLKKILPINPTILEAGAQFGEDTQWMSQMWPQGKIYSFEPSPASFAELQKVAAQLHNVTVNTISALK